MKRLFVLGAFLFSGFLSASPINNIVVFGDSLSDNGNLYAHMEQKFPPSPPYFKGRFSDGPVWVEYLCRMLFPKNPSEHLQDYAFGGAMVSKENRKESPLFTLDGQVTKYLSTQKDESQIHDNLHIIWIGSNNYLGTPADEEHRLVKDINEETTRNLERLATSGARNILILNLPDIGRTPFATFLDTSCPESDTTCMSKILSYFSKEHNKVLKERIEQLKLKFPNVNWIHFDLNHMFIDVMENPGNYQINHVDVPCHKPNDFREANKKSILKMISNLKLKSRQDTCDDYLFYDLLHPTSYAHKVIAEKVKTELQNLNMDIS